MVQQNSAELWREIQWDIENGINKSKKLQLFTFLKAIWTKEQWLETDVRFTQKSLNSD